MAMNRGLNRMSGGPQPGNLPWTLIHAAGTLAARPIASFLNKGFFYLATDTNGGTLYRSNGTAWLQAAGAVSGSGGYWVQSGSIIYYTTGNVGIGTSSPAALLDVFGTVSNFTTALTGRGQINVQDTSAYGAGVGPAITFSAKYDGSANTSCFAAIRGVKDTVTNGNAGGRLMLFTSPSTGVLTERLRIDSSGNVGIGTTSPSTQLHVAGSVNGFILSQVQNSNSGSAAYCGLYLVGDVATSALACFSSNYGSGLANTTMLYTGGPYPLCLGTNSVERTRIDSSGNTLMKGLFTQYNNIATVANGVPSILGKADLTGQTAAIAATTLYTPATTGLFKITTYQQVTTSNSFSTIGSTTLTYNDGDGNVAQSLIMDLATQSGTIATLSGTSTTSNLNGQSIIYAKAGTAINFGVGFNANGMSGMQFAVHFRVEAMG